MDLLQEEELELSGGQEDPFQLLEKGGFGRSSDLRRNLNFLHLSGKLANLVYSLGITDTDFYPHQYKPLLTLLDSPINGLLIADEVGLGKTIEAGLIWTELRARFDLRRLLIVCPAILRPKWQTELSRRFGVRAEIADARTLLSTIEATPARGGDVASIVSYHSVRPPRRWKADSGEPPSSSQERLAEALLQLARSEVRAFDLVVFDEAHYMRNPESTTCRLGQLLRDASEYQVMLSATPINLKNQDLLVLLHLLDPDHFERSGDFEMLLEANEPLVRARDAVLDVRSTAKEIHELLLDASGRAMLGNSLRLKQLVASPPTDEDLADETRRAELAADLDRISLLGHVVSRTRKRDIKERRIQRRPVPEAVEMAPCEADMYERVTDIIREYAASRNLNDGFLLAAPQRQVTSCPAATAAEWLRGSDEVDEDLAAELEDEASEDNGIDRADHHPLLEYLVPRISQYLDRDMLERSDTKFARLLEVASGFFQQYPDEKVILFTTFRPTARYLKRRLEAEGYAAVLVTGEAGTGPADREKLLEAFRDQPDKRFLVSTEVAAEGLDMQFCRVLINYDLPWNPTRIEQRIGRIDRLGQEAEVVQIWNLYFKETLDERIVQRLLKRVRIFESALGASEAIVGSELGRLQSALLSRRLTREEEDREIQRAVVAVEQARQREKELEENAAHMLAHGQRVLEQVEAARELARHITDEDLLVYVKDYLEGHWKGFRFEQDPDNPLRFTIQLPASLAAALGDFLAEKGLAGQTGLDTGTLRTCVFYNRISARPRAGEEVVHQFHPLVRFICKDLKERNEHFYPLVALRAPRSPHSLDVPAGRYAFFARCWNFSGLREEEELAVAAVGVTSGLDLEARAAERLLQLARTEGTDWLGAAGELGLAEVQRAMVEAEGQLNLRYQTVLERKRSENQDRATFQREAIERHLQRRLQTLAEVRERHELSGRKSLVRATEGQIEKLKERMRVRVERVRQQAEIRPERRLVCAGVIDFG